MSVHRSIRLWGVWYLQRKSTPKNEVLQLKTLDFWRLWKWRNWCDLEDLVFIRGTWSVKTFVLVVSFSLSWVIGNTVLLKGVEEILRKKFPCDAQLKILHLPIPSSEAIGNLIQFSHILQWHRRSSSGLWGICSDWGVRNSPVRIAYIVRNMIALRNLRVKYSDRCCAMGQLSQNIYPPNGHIRQGHLCLIM